MPLNAVIGRVILAAMPISLGIAIANHLISRSASRTESDGDEGVEAVAGGAQTTQHQTLLELGATAAGALFFSLNIAPTDEVGVLANELPALYLPAVILASLLVTYAIVFVADFGDQNRRQTSHGVLQHPPTETVAAYLISLLVGAGALWMFGQIGPGTDWYLMYAKVIALGLPAAIGGAAGRLAV
jgi:putative integral membrane protein (TIGR02587 family)